MASNSLTQAPKKVGISNFLAQEAVKAQINNVVGDKGAQRFVTGVVSSVTVNPMLQDCSNASIMSAALLGESLGLAPSPQLGLYYMVPYNDKERGKVAQFQLGYKGYIQLAIRSGQYKKLNVLAIKEGELIRFDALNEEIEVKLIEDEEERENAKTIGYYAMFEYVNGFRKAIYWSKAKMERHALRYSKGYAAKKGYTFWEKDFDSMAAKTMLRQLLGHWGILSTELQTAYDADMAVINSDGSRDYVDGFEADYVVDAVQQEFPINPPETDAKAALKGGN